MKALPVLVLTLGLIAGVPSLHAQSDVIIKQRARAIQNQNNAQQGVPPPAQAAPQPGAAPAPSGSINPDQQKNIDKLGSDLATVSMGAQATTDQKDQLQKDFVVLAKGAAKPSADQMKKLADDLGVALAGKSLPAAKQSDLSKAINVVVNCINLSQAQVQAFISSAQSALKSCGATDTEAQTVAADLKAIATDIQKSKSKLYGN